jgi:NADH pyrophosphatase NudC (nudix superfamily)
MAGPQYRFCPVCATELQPLAQLEDSGEKTRLRCPACQWTHWNNPTPVLAAVIECADRDGRVLLARNAAWTGRMFALITGFLEAGESPEHGIRREVLEETSLQIDALELIGVYEFERMNQIIIAYHALARGDIRLSPELAEYKLFAPQDIICWPAGTGFALADWLRSRGHEPTFMEFRRP